MMSRCCWWRLALVLSSGLLVQTAEAQQFALSSSPRALCITDPYGTHFHSWYGSPIAFNSYFYRQYGGAYSSGDNGTSSSGYFGGGIPAVASAATPEWIIQRTSVFPIGAYDPWAASPGAYAVPWRPNIGMKPPRPNSQPASQQDFIPAPARDTFIRQVSGTWPISEERGPPILAEGDRLLREGQSSQAYLRYLDAQRYEGDRGEVYFRQAFALVAMGRYPLAVAKAKRGLQVDPNYPLHGATLNEVFGVDNSDQKNEYRQQVVRWTNADERDPDRLFLMGVLLHFDEDPRAGEFFDAAWKLTNRRQHLQAFR